MPAYAVRADPNHIYQGDILGSVTIGVPRPGGTLDTPSFPVLVVSHDCEFTKIRDRPDGLLLVAPVRELRAFRHEGRDALIRDGRMRAFFYLPHEDPLDDEYVADLRLIQPETVDDLSRATYWTSLADETKDALRAKLVEFFVRGRLIDP